MYNFKYICGLSLNSIDINIIINTGGHGFECLEMCYPLIYINYLIFYEKNEILFLSSSNGFDNQ